ncbi:hypothetical protein HDU96_004964, partial [Phlyctochytrium bullatum]
MHPHPATKSHLALLLLLSLPHRTPALQIPLTHPSLGGAAGPVITITPGKPAEGLREGVVQGATLTDGIVAKPLVVEQKAVVGLTGGPTTTGCWRGIVSVGDTDYNVLIDSGSSDLLIPRQGLNNYSATAPAYNTQGKTQLSSFPYNGRFADGSSWTGFYFQDRVALGSSNALAPFAVMVDQNPSIPVTDGISNEGLLGIGFDRLAIYQESSPNTVLRSLVSKGVLKRDAVAFRGCNPNATLPSVLDLGAEDVVSLGCPATRGPFEGGAVVAWVDVPDPLYYGVNVVEV